MTEHGKAAPLLAWDGAILDEAKETCERGDVDGAIAILRDRLLSSPYPSHWEVFSALKWLCVNQERVPEAIDIFSRVAESYEPNSSLGALTAWRAVSHLDPLSLRPYLRMVEVGTRMVRAWDPQGELMTSHKAILQRAHERFLAAGQPEAAATLEAAASFGPEDVAAEEAEEAEKRHSEERKAREQEEKAQAEARRRDAARGSGRVFRFPAEGSLGTLSVRARGADGAWESLGAAQGEVPIPAASDVRLDVSDDYEGDAPDLSPLASLGPDDLRELSLAYARIEDDSLAPLAGLTGLRWLSLAFVDMACSGFLRSPHLVVGMHVSDIPSVFEGFGVTDKGLDHLARLTELRELVLTITGITDRGLPKLGQLRQLEVLHLGGSHVSDAGLPHLAALTSLRALDLQRTAVLGLGLASLAPLRQIETLLLDTNFLSLADLAVLAELPSLRTLNLARTGASVEGVSACVGLERLNLSQNPIGDDDLLWLARLPRLQVLAVAQTEITDAGVARFLDRAGRPIQVVRDCDPNWMRPAEDTHHAR